MAAFRSVIGQSGTLLREANGALLLGVIDQFKDKKVVAICHSATSAVVVKVYDPDRELRLCCVMSGTGCSRSGQKSAVPITVGRVVLWRAGNSRGMLFKGLLSEICVLRRRYMRS